MEKNMEEILIIGAGGFGREVLWTINDCNQINDKYSIIGFIDDDKSLHGQKIDGIPVLGGLEWFDNNYKKSVSCVITVGDSIQRGKIVKQLEKNDPTYTNIIHPTVIFSKLVTIGEGTIIQAGSILTVNIKIGKHVHINIDSTIGHDSNINDYVTINPGVHINGKTQIGNSVNIGSGAVMKQEIKIGARSIIGAGSVLLEDVLEGSLYVGVPAKLKRKLN
jgi:sugar O-acyltransferase (sialic acid O-acetyltransferase NeuD family)